MKTNFIRSIVFSLFVFCTFFEARAQNVYYIYSNSTGGPEPWFTTTNTTAMNTTFGVEGTDWFRRYFETLVPAAIFSPTTCFVFLEGGDNHADELETFFLANKPLIQSWVAAGGKLFMNAAPNEGDGMSFGFGGVSLNYPWYTSSVTALIPAHPIFNGPHLPVGAGWSGSSFSHATISGAGLTKLIGDTFDPTLSVLSELAWGSGKVLFGGMTTNNFHEPELESANLRANILEYLACEAICIPEVPEGLYTDNITSTQVKLHWDAIPGVDKYAASVYTAAGVFVVKKKTSATFANITGLTPGTDYLFKVRSICLDAGTMSSFSAPSYFSTLMRLGENENDIAIYPNPSNGNFSLNITNAINTNYDLTIINSLGQTLLSRELIINESDFSTEINMENVTPGIYIVNLRNDLSNTNYSVLITD